MGCVNLLTQKQNNSDYNSTTNQRHDSDSYSCSVKMYVWFVIYVFCTFLSTA